MTTATARRLTLAELSHKERNERFDRLQENAQRLGDRAIQISPTHISFDKVTVNDVADRTVTITNTGHAGLVIRIALGRLSAVPGPPRRPAAAAPGCARRPGRDAARGWRSGEDAGRGRHAGRDAGRGRPPGRGVARGRG